MLFKRFFDKRKRASDQPKKGAARKPADSLATQALNDPDPGRRIQAIEQLWDLEPLGRALTQDAEARVRDSATKRLCQVLTSPSQDTPPPAPLLEALIERLEPTATAELALKGVQPATRAAAIPLIQDQALLARCAIEDRLAANRSLAIEHVHEKAALEEILRGIGKRDKNVHRVARERIRNILELEERPRRVREQGEDICAKLERLGRLGNWAQDRALLEHLERQWSDIQAEAEAEPELAARFHAERERFLDAYAAYSEANATRVAQQAAQAESLARAQALVDALENLSARADEDDAEAERARIAREWDSLPPSKAPERRALEERYRTQVKAKTAADAAEADRNRQAERLRETTSRIEQLLDSPRSLDSKRAQNLLEKGRALAEALPGDPCADDFHACAKRLEDRLKNQSKQAERKLAQFEDRLAELQKHLEAGELKKADPLYQSLQAALGLIETSGIGRNQASQFARQLRSLAPRLRELQNWRRWGADQHRDELCAAMEALIDEALPLEALSERLRRLQMDWKGLDKTGSPANQALWDRFHAASDAVYARCRPFMEAQSAEREANRVARERTCEQLETFLSKVDWDRVDWKKILRAEREMRRAWAAIGPTEGRYRKTLERRFHQSLRQLDQRLDAERKRNQAFKQDLVTQVEALAEQPDLDTAIEQTKALQRTWHTTVPARQKDENRLWQRFRAACDAVFERRNAVQQAHASELQDNLQARKALCVQAEEVANRERDPKRLAAAQRELQERWSAAESLPVPRQAASEVSRAWRRSIDALERQRRDAEARQRLASLELLQRQAELCDRLEHAALAATEPPPDWEATRTAWLALDTQEAESLQAAIQARFDRAASAAEDPSLRAALAEQAPANAEQLEQLCLQLEIAAGLESPPELAKQRLELQVARLAERLAEGEDDPIQGATKLLHHWYLTGPTLLEPSVAQRFERIRDTLTRHPPGASTTSTLEAPEAPSE